MANKKGKKWQEVIANFFIDYTIIHWITDDDKRCTIAYITESNNLDNTR
jgi:hypothetical protein